MRTREQSKRRREEATSSGTRTDTHKESSNHSRKSSKKKSKKQYVDDLAGGMRRNEQNGEGSNNNKDDKGREREEDENEPEWEDGPIPVSVSGRDDLQSLEKGITVEFTESPQSSVKRNPPKRASAEEKELAELVHKVHLICLLARGRVVDNACDDPLIQNERGQVEVWSEKCLPPGTVHLRFPRLVPVVKRLEIDFALAMLGFEYRSGRSFPVFDGIVVCTEFKEAIMAAYAEEEEKRGSEEKKRTETQALSRWYQLLSSIMTRQRLNASYGDGSTVLSDNSSALKDSQYGTTRSCKNNVKSSVPRGVGLRESGGNHEHVFPVDDQSFDEESSVRTKRCPCGFSIQMEEL
ncbi:hypothetical protein QJS10_CPA06g02003 [Acorus calamus]|uniref:Rad4 beta-hairpin domain-containing protein n=1 Tax=Acorus calamus TaxID=4465 RepID=A0AAV9EM19_ACOCL|nr:hypothetical protein QJS10_CPA06g02003 [Acorus calamus]